MTKKRATKRDTSTDVESNAARHGEDDYRVGPGCPPREYQWKPGESGNPKGNVRHRTHLWEYLTQYMAMTDAEVAKLDRAKLTQAQQTALGLVKRIKAGEKLGSTAFARYIVDREEGKAVEHIIIGEGIDLTDDECEELRNLIQGKHGRDTD
jgi:hypothetical protein